jgi:flagellar hook assembly protein FlgD
MKHLLFLLLMIVSTLSLWAQWVDDPSSNSPIFTLNGDTTLPKIQTTSTGNIFISCNSAPSGNYDLRLQYLDDTGAPIWPADGILVSNHTTMSWITDYDMGLLADSVAVIAYSDVRLNGNDFHPSVYAVSAHGQFLWGADGIQLSNQGTFEPNPVVAVTEQGNTVVAWMRDTSPQSIVMQMISPTGQLLWGDGIVYSPTDNSDYWYPNLVPVHTDTGNSNEMILIWEKRYGMYTNNLAAQRFNGSGAPVWNTDLAISDNGGFPFYSRFSVINDENGGAFVSWHVYRGTYFDAYYQHVNGNGTDAFPVNGVIFSSDASRMYLEPKLVYDKVNNFIYGFCQMKNGNQDMFGILGQKFDSTGNPLWTSAGRDIISLSGIEIENINAKLAGDSSVLSFLQGFVEMGINAKVVSTRISPSGDFMWTNQFVEMCNVQSGKQKMIMGPFVNNQAAVVWVDDRNDIGDVYAQNIWTTGEMGGAVGNDDHVAPGVISQLNNYPNPFNSTTMIAYNVKKSGQVKLDIYNIKGQLVKTLISENKTAGTFSTAWNGTDNMNKAVTSGVYFLKMTIGNDQVTKKMVLVR